MPEQPWGVFPDKNALKSYFESVDRRLEEEIASRPASLRLPRKGSRFRAVGDTVVDVVTYLRGGEDGLYLPIQVEQRTIPQGEVIRLDYEPDPTASTHCSLVPERYRELENSLVDAKFRNDPEYSGFSFSIGYLQLNTDFEWLED